MSDFTDKMEELGPVGWWRLGEAHDSPLPSAANEVPGGNAGTYHGLDSDDFGQSGAIASDSDTAIEVEAASTEYVEVPDSASYSLARANDGFGRSTSWSSSWGTADSGGAWSAQVSSGNYYRCNGSHALIDQTASSGTWQQGLSVTRTDCDLQVRVRWNDHADGSYITPVTVVARQGDTSNYYGVELLENSDESLDLRLIKKVSGTYSLIDSGADLADYNIDSETGWGDWWYVRFQLEGTTLRAKTWKSGTDQPSAWALEAVDTSHDTSGTIAIRSSNSGSDARPTVQFDDFWAQSVGLTVHLWMRPDVLNFSGEGTGPYVYIIGKGGADQYEWAVRFYTDDTTNNRDSRVSAYMWNLSGGEAAGAYFQPNAGDTIEVGTWYQFVATFDSGDALDLGAGVTLFKDGQRIQGPPSSATLYSNSSYQIYPKRGSASLKFGTRNGTSYFSGGLDEVALFDRVLSDTEIADLYEAST